MPAGDAPPLRLIPLSGSVSDPIVIDSNEPQVLGRGTDCDVCLTDAACSRRHLTIIRHASQWMVMDLESRHGTFVNGIRIEANRQVPICHGDMLRAGGATFRIETQPLRATSLSRTDAAIVPGTIVEQVAPRELESLAQRRLSLLVDGCSRLYQATSETQLAQEVVSLILEGTGYPRAAMLTWPESSDEVQVHAVRDIAGSSVEDFAFSRSLLRAVQNGQMARLSRSDMGKWGQSIAGLGIAAALCAPLIIDSVVIGAIYLDARGGEAPPQADAPGFCHTVAHIASLALCNLKRMDMADRQKQLDADLKIAQEAQMFLLPRATGQIGRVRYASRTCPGSTVGGDLFDVFPIDHDRVGICFGDITGHGIGAAILMTAVLSHLRAVLVRGGDAAAAVAETNSYLTAHSSERMFATLWVGVLDQQAGVLTFVDAGHGHWLICPKGGQPYCPDTAGNLIIGVQSDAPYIAEQVPFAPGDRLVLYSDGLVEQPNERIERFGSDQLTRVISQSSRIEDDVTSVFGALKEFAGSNRFADDTTIASLEIMDQALRVRD